MANYDYDYFVIGGGSGGVRSARIAAGHGAKVALAEKQYLGGTCVNVGCVPKKIFSYAAQFSHEFEDAPGYGWNVGESKHDWQTLVKNKDAEITRLNGIYKNLLENSGVQILNGHAKLVDTHTIEVDGKTYTADKILIAVGGKANTPNHPGAELAVTSDHIFYLENFPKEILIIGGGYIAVEFASIFKGLGADVTLFYRGDLFLRGFDDILRHGVKQEMEKQGINLVFNNPAVTSIEKQDDRLAVQLSNDSAMTTDCVFYAIGRSPLTDNLGLDAAGIETDENGLIKIDKDFKTNVDNIYAVGDVSNKIQLTPVALAEGHALADNLFNKDHKKVSYENIATAVFTIPPMATCGLTEDQALEKYSSLRIYESSFRSMKFIMAGRDEKTIMKLIVDDASDVVVGVHMMGKDTPEMMQAISTVMLMNGKKSDFDRTIGIHPTSAEEFVTMRSVTRTVSA